MKNIEYSILLIGIFSWKIIPKYKRTKGYLKINQERKKLISFYKSTNKEHWIAKKKS